MDPAPWVRSGGPWVIRPRPEPLAGPPGPGRIPGRSLPSFCRYRKKVRRKGKRDKRPLERDRTAKGQTIAWQSKENKTITYQNTVPRTERQPVQEAALWACLEGQPAKTANAWRSPRLGIGQSRYRPRLVTSHRRKKGRKTLHPFLVPYFYRVRL